MIRFKMLEPDEYRYLDNWFEEAQIPRPDPNFSRVAAAFENDDLIGFIVIQFVIHSEPIWVHEDYRGEGIWKTLAAMVDANLIGSGAAGCYTQPTTDQTRHMCEELGYVEMKHPLYVRIYDSHFKSLVEDRLKEK